MSKEVVIRVLWRGTGVQGLREDGQREEGAFGRYRRQGEVRVVVNVEVVEVEADDEGFEFIEWGVRNLRRRIRELSE